MVAESIIQEVIEKKIFLIRGQKVMLSSHLAELYQVEVKRLIQAVKRNRERFPDDFMFQLSLNEFRNLKSQFVTSSWGGLRRSVPYAFTEQGVAMLSSVLRSNRAIQIYLRSADTEISSSRSGQCALGCTPGNRRNLRPVSPFLGFVNDHSKEEPQICVFFLAAHLEFL